MPVDFRPATPDDHEETYRIFAKATGDLLRRHNFPDHIPVDPPPRFLAFRRHAYEHHLGSYWVATDDGQTVGFAIGIRHPDLWYLAALHVLPEYQGRGTGKQLLDLALRGSARPGDKLCVISQSIQPVSNAIYVEAKMLPWAPVLDWVGEVVDPLPDPPPGTRFQMTSDAEAVTSVDRDVMGTNRSSQILFLLDQPDLRCGLYAVEDAPVGYAFISDDGGIGPVAATHQSHMRPLLAAAISTVATRAERSVSLQVVGASTAIHDLVRGLGLRIAGSSNILLSSRPLWQTGRYIPSIGDALL